MSFADELAKFNAKQRRVSRDLFVNVVSAVKDSIVNGSQITGAPGQPVDTGTLKASWHETFESPTVASIGTNVVYASDIEEGTRSLRGRRGDAGVSASGSTQRLVLRSEVGGFHSVEKTIQGFDKLVETEARKLGAT